MDYLCHWTIPPVFYSSKCLRILNEELVVFDELILTRTSLNVKYYFEYFLIYFILSEYSVIVASVILHLSNDYLLLLRLSYSIHLLVLASQHCYTKSIFICGRGSAARNDSICFILGESIMLKIDLITGFLGAGKTTFIHTYLHHLQSQGLKVAIIENEFGGADVDTTLLKKEDVNISTLTGVCMCCKGKSMFQNMIINAASEGYDRILVEPSGIYDVDEFFETMLDPNVSHCSEIGSIITILDATTNSKMSDEAKYISFSQLHSSGKIVISKSQMASEEELSATIQNLNQLMQEHGSSRSFDQADLLIKDWTDLTPADFEEIQNAGYFILDHKKVFLEHESLFQAFCYANYCRDEEHLTSVINSLFADDSHGIIFRIKGHIRDLSKQWYEINCTRDAFSLKKADVKRGLFVIIGQNLDEAYLKKLFLTKAEAKALMS